MSDENNNKIYGNLKEKVISTRLETVASATSRTRKTFLIMIVFCAAINIALWNSYLSWVRDMAMPKVGSTIELKATEDKELSVKMANENKKVLIDEWIRSQTISFNLLGIKLTTFDLSVLGSISLVIVMLWYFFIIRRENRTIVPFLKEISDEVEKLKKDNEPEALELANLIFLGIVNNTVFFNIADNDNPSKIIKNDKNEIEITFESDTVETVNKLIFIAIIILLLFLAFTVFRLMPIVELNLYYLHIIIPIVLLIFIFVLIKRRISKNTKPKLINYIIELKNVFIKLFRLEDWWEKNKNEAVFFRWIIYLLLFLPSITIFLIILSDISSLFDYSAYRDPNKFLIQHALPELPKIIIFDSIAFIGFLMTTYISLRSINFSKGIRDSLNTFYKEFIDTKPIS